MTASFALPRIGTPRPRRLSGRPWRRMAIFIWTAMPAGILSGTRPITPKTNYRMVPGAKNYRPLAPRWNGLRSPAISSAFRNGRTACWPITKKIPTASCPKAGAMKSSASSKAACGIYPFPELRSSGVCRYRATMPTSCTSGSMP